MRRFHVIICAITFVAVFAAAQEQEVVKRSFTSPGVFEVGGNAGFTISWAVNDGETAQSSVKNFTLLPFLGYFVIDGLEVVANPLGLSYTSAGGNSLQLFMLGGAAYNFRTQTRIFPFVEGLAGFAYQRTEFPGGNTGTASGFCWGGRGGIKILMTGSGLLNMGVQYLQITVDDDPGSPRDGSNQLLFSAGFTIWL